MKVKILKTTDKKYEGVTMSIEITSKGITNDLNLDFDRVKYTNNKIELQSSNYTVKAVILE